MQILRVRPARQPLRGVVGLPSDKSISHRALILASLAAGPSRISGFSYGEDNLATLRAFAQLGVVTQDDFEGTLRVNGVGLGELQPPAERIDCGNSGTTMRLLAGVLAAQSFASELVGDASLSRRPMGRVITPLRARGAKIEGRTDPERPGVITAPLRVGPLPAATKLAGVDYELAVASAQVKSALLLAGLFAAGPTVVHEPVATRDHTERMLRALGVSVQTQGLTVRLDPPAAEQGIQPFDVTLPGDLSAAAFLLVAAQLVPGSEVTTTRTGLNPTRTGILDIIRGSGGSLQVRERGQALGEPWGDVTSAARTVGAQQVGGALAVRAIDEIAVAAVLASRAEGITEFCDVAELRVKESDRIARMAELLRAFGVQTQERADGLLVTGQPQGKLRATRISSSGDHRIAMSGAVLGLVADGETVIEDVDCIATSFPGFASSMRALGAEVAVE